MKKRISTPRAIYEPKKKLSWVERHNLHMKKYSKRKGK